MAKFLEMWAEGRREPAEAREIRETQEAAGWTDESLMAYILGFVEEHGMLAGLAFHLATIAAAEAVEEEDLDDEEAEDIEMGDDDEDEDAEPTEPEEEDLMGYLD